MKYILLICEAVQEINRIRRNFDSAYTLKATGTVDSAMSIIKASKPDLIFYYLGSDYKDFFSFYHSLRSNGAYKDIPLTVMADINIMKPLTENVAIQNGRIVGTSISKENLTEIIKSSLGEKTNI